jgi:hypothetical protein
MAEDIKDIAQMMGTQFSEAVKLAEQREAEEIESILKSMNNSYEIYVTKLAKIHENEQAAETVYQDELLSLSARLEKYKQAKLGNKVSDESIRQRGLHGFSSNNGRGI